jgi:hypothetical protein
MNQRFKANEPEMLESINMRTTVNLSPEVEVGARQLAQAEGLSLSAAVDRLAARGLRRSTKPSAPFVQRTAPMGVNVDLSCTADVLELVDGPGQR